MVFFDLWDRQGLKALREQVLDRAQRPAPSGIVQP